MGILVVTAVHGFFPDLAPKAFKAIDKYVPELFLHIVYDDFSPSKHKKKYLDTAGPIQRRGKLVGEREVRHLRDLGAEGPPNYNLSLGNAFEELRANPEFEAILTVAHNVRILPDTVKYFREAADCYEEVTGGKLGVLAPIYLNEDGTAPASVGGRVPSGDISKSNMRYMYKEYKNHSLPHPRIMQFPWVHTACLWIPRSTLDETSLMPDPDFPLYSLDLALCTRIMELGRDIAVVSRAAAHRGPRGASTALLYGKENAEKEANAAYIRLQKKSRGY